MTKPTRLTNYDDVLYRKASTMAYEGNASKPTVDDLLDALKRGDIVAKVMAMPKGIGVTFAAKGSGRVETVSAQIHETALPFQSASAQKAENNLQKLLVDILVEECAIESRFPLEVRIHSRVEDVVAPVTPDPGLIAHKAQWFTRRCMDLLSRRDPKTLSRADLVTLVQDIASSGRGKGA